MSIKTDDGKVVLGDECDEALKAKLRSAVNTLGGTIKIVLNGVAGSQEVVIGKATIDGHVVTIESETSMGLSISGNPQVIGRICNLLGVSSKQ